MKMNSDNSFINLLNIEKNVDINPTNYSPLSLAYIGDAVFDMCVRTMLMGRGNMPVNKYHHLAKDFVRAKSQSGMYFQIEKVATQEELSILKRGRNATSFSKAKNATMADYRHATGLEALFGYLYLKNDMERILEIFTICIDKGETNG